MTKIGDCTTKCRLDPHNIEACDELDEISGDEQLQQVYIWCRDHKRYTWQWVWLPISGGE
jgi:hypothetical protein